MIEIDEYKYHELCEYYPTLSEDELEALAIDIKKNGLLQKIVLYQGKILDGKNRYLACKKIGFEFKTEHFINLSPENLPGSFIISMNLLRRHIESPAYRIELAIRMLEYDKKLKRIPEIEDINLRKIVENAENKIIAKNAKSDRITVEKAREIITRQEVDPEIKKKWEKARQSQAKLSIKKIYEDHIKPPKKKRRSIKGVQIPKKLTNLQLRQELEDLKKENKSLRSEKIETKILYEKVKKIAIRLGYWDAILKELIPTVEKKESSFPTPKQLRKAELL